MDRGVLGKAAGTVACRNGSSADGKGKAQRRSRPERLRPRQQGWTAGGTASRGRSGSAGARARPASAVAAGLQPPASPRPPGLQACLVSSWPRTPAATCSTSRGSPTTRCTSACRCATGGAGQRRLPTREVRPAHPSSSAGHPPPSANLLRPHRMLHHPIPPCRHPAPHAAGHHPPDRGGGCGHARHVPALLPARVRQPVLHPGVCAGSGCVWGWGWVWGREACNLAGPRLTTNVRAWLGTALPGMWSATPVLDVRPARVMLIPAC